MQAAHPQARPGCLMIPTSMQAKALGSAEGAIWGKESTDGATGGGTALEAGEVPAPGCT